MCIVEHSREVYRHLADEQSRMIYMNRLNYSLTGDMRFIEDLVNRTLRQNQTWRSFCESLKKKQAAMNWLYSGQESGEISCIRKRRTSSAGKG